MEKTLTDNGMDNLEADRDQATVSRRQKPTIPNLLEMVLEGIDVIQSQQEKQGEKLEEITENQEALEEKIDDLAYGRDYPGLDE